MATIITLFCLVHGDPVERAFPVDISNDKSVGHLKNKIKKEIPTAFNNIDAKDVTLWKVDIPNNDEDAIKQIVFKETVVIKKMSPASEIGEYFENTPTKKCIHVVIECPLGK
jgi:Crinkler effector protein N-terminal domain